MPGNLDVVYINTASRQSDDPTTWLALFVSQDTLHIAPV